MSQPASLSRGCVAVLCAVSTLTSVATDIMLPATATIAEGFGVAQHHGGLMVGAFFLGFAFGQLAWGLASDAYGRRPMMLLSMALFTLLSVGCTIAPGFWVLVCLRFAQGLSAGAPVIARALTRDMGAGPELTRLMALLLATSSIGPLLGPLLGGILLIPFNWRACFAFLVCLGAVLCWLTWRYVPETNVSKRPDRFSLQFLAGATAELSRVPPYLISAGVIILLFTGYGALLGQGAIVVIHQYDVSPQGFGLLFAVAAGFSMIGAFCVRGLANRLELRRIIALGLAVLALSVLGHLVCLAYVPSLTLYWGVVSLYLLALGAVLSASMSEALRPIDTTPGFAAALISAFMMLGGFSGGLMASVFYTGDHRALSGTMAFFGFAAITLFVAGRLRENAQRIP